MVSWARLVTFQVWCSLYKLCVIACLVLLLNATVTHTYTRGNVFGTLFSLRYNSLQWFALFCFAMRIWTPIVIDDFVQYRRVFGYRFFFLCFYYLLLCFAFANLAIYWGFYSSANGLTSYNNPANDKRLCCDARIYTNPDFGCANTAPCPFPPDSYGVDADFLWMLSIVTVFAFVDFVMGMVMTFEMIRRPPKAADSEGAGEDEMDDAITMEQEKVKREQALLRQRRRVQNEDE